MPPLCRQVAIGSSCFGHWSEDLTIVPLGQVYEDGQVAPITTLEPSGQRVVTGVGTGVVELFCGHSVKVAPKETPSGQVILPAGGITEQGVPLHQPKETEKLEVPPAVELHQYLFCLLHSVSVLGIVGQTEPESTCVLSQQVIYPALGDSQQA